MQASSMGKFAAVVGIDWADRKHDICLLPAGSNKRESCVLVHRPEAIAQWAEGLRQRFGGRPIAVCLELAKDRWCMPCSATRSWCSSRSIRRLWLSTGRPSMCGSHCPSPTASGPKPTTSSSALAELHIRPRCALWRSSGSASRFAAGTTARLMTRPPTSARLSAAARRS